MSRPSSSIAQRLWSHVDKDDPRGCWIWTASTNSGGYGQISITYPGKSPRPYRVHRVVFEMLVGPIPPGMILDHICHVRRCCNPEHLRLATIKQNAENTFGHRDSKTGVRGVYMTNGRYAVQVGHNGRNHWGGLYDTLETAERAAIALRNSLHSYNIADRSA